MALDKKQTSLLTKIGIGLIAAVLVLAFIPWDSIGLGGGGNTQDPATGTGQLEAIAARYAPTIAANDQKLASEPTSYTVLVTQGNVYFDWAIDVQQASQSGADLPIWLAASVYYGRAIEQQSGDPNVATDYAVSLYYSGNTQAAIDVIEPVLEENPDFAVAFYNAGIFYDTAGRGADAVRVMQRYIELDPSGQTGSPDVAQDVIDSNINAPQSAPTTSAPSTSTP